MMLECCSAACVYNDGCINSKRVSLTMPTGGSVIYGVAHQHVGEIGATLYGEDGRIICSSIPTYGAASEAGNKTGYVVRRSTCYPSPGSVKISTGESLLQESNYGRGRRRFTGVMGSFYFLDADESPEPNSFPHGPV